MSEVDDLLSGFTRADVELLTKVARGPRGRDHRLLVPDIRDLADRIEADIAAPRIRGFMKRGPSWGQSWRGWQIYPEATDERMAVTILVPADYVGRE